MPGLWKQVRDIDKAVIAWNDATLVAFGANVASSFVNLLYYEDMLVGRTATGGTYAFEIDWSADGTTVLITEVFVVANNTTLRIPTAAPYARFRVKNTDGAVNFSAHRTFVTL